MAFENSAKNAMLDAQGALSTYMSLHSGFPATAINEITGGTPAYARKAITWAVASAGSKSINVVPVFDVPASTIAAIGYWSAATAGTLYGGSTVTNETYVAQGEYKVSTATMTLP
ncbi:MAG: hypothetical protein WCO84_01340 [bacterium]